MPRATPPSNNFSELFKVLFNQQGNKNILTSTPGSQTKGITSQSRTRTDSKISKMTFLPSELMVNTWFPQRQEQTLREKVKSKRNNPRFGQEDFILRKKDVWTKYLPRLGSNQGRAQATMLHKNKGMNYCRGALRNKTRKHTQCSSKKIWTRLVADASKRVARHTGLNHHERKKGGHSLMSVEDPGGPHSAVAQCC